MYETASMFLLRSLWRICPGCLFVTGQVSVPTLTLTSIKSCSIVPSLPGWGRPVGWGKGMITLSSPTLGRV